MLSSLVFLDINACCGKVSLTIFANYKNQKSLIHFAIDGSQLSMRSEWVKNILRGNNSDLSEFKGKKGLLFSNITLEKFIADEYLHDKYTLSEDTGRSIRTYSSGEQKKALLTYLKKQNPEFLILDNPFDCLDSESVKMLKYLITELSSRIPLIQVFKRKADLLPFIKEILVIENDRFLHKVPIHSYVKDQQLKPFFNKAKSIPPPAETYKNIPEILIQLKNVSVKYHEHCILNNISWTIKKGEFWQLSGPNGSGKTTILSMIFGDNPKAFGQDVTLFGNRKGSGESIWELKKKIGYFTPSMTELFTRRQTLLQMIVSGLTDSIGMYSKPTHLQLTHAREWLKTLRIEEREKQVFQKVSQVEQRMILIARAMIKHPPLLILDEPSTGLDDRSALNLTNLINAIARESTTAIIYVSHRKEPGLEPEQKFELIPSENGSTGIKR